MTEGTSASDWSGTTEQAGLFDIRIIIATLIGIDGLILTIMGLLASDADKSKADGLNINLWAGLAMLLVSAVLIAWAQLRPIAVPAHVEEAGNSAP